MPLTNKGGVVESAVIGGLLRFFQRFFKELLNMLVAQAAMMLVLVLGQNKPVEKRDALAAPAVAIYTVQAGDTLDGVAQTFAMTSAELREWNPSVTPRRTWTGALFYLVEGQRLIVRVVRP